MNPGRRQGGLADNRVVQVGWAAWTVLLACWTVALLIPEPQPASVAAFGDAIGVPMSVTITPEERFTTAKILHLSFYGTLVALLAWLPGSPELRWKLVVLLALHASATEGLQTFVPGRIGCLTDVLVDHGGITAGLVTWSWALRRQPSVRASSPGVAA
jgi:hypothetical protein